MNRSKIYSRIPTVSILFLIIVPIVAHLLFSRLGFNPTDDGFTLAYSRRILEGQIPHRDFIIIRPVLSPLLHVPFVLWGGDYTYLLSRFFVWFQFTCMAWAGVYVIQKGLRLSFGIFEKICIALISLAVSAHTFPTMAWHTIDGLFFTLIGTALCFTGKQPGKLIGYFLVGMAYLCKQSFIFMAPFLIIILGDWRKIKYWLAILMPGIFYIAFLLVSGAFQDAIVQLTSQSDLLTYGFNTYNQPKLLLIVILGYFSARLVIGGTQINIPVRDNFKRWIGLLILSTILLIVISITFVSGRYVLALSYWIFSLVVGVVVCFLIEKGDKPGGFVNLAFIFLMMAWSASISIGWPYPDLASGQLVALLLAFVVPLIQRNLGRLNLGYLYTPALVFFSSIVLVSFGIARLQHIYRELPSNKLTERLDSVLPGGKEIRTDQNTYEFLVDLQDAIKLSKNFGQTYAIIPDCAGCWVKSQEVNPLPIDWVQGVELNKPALISRIIQDLELLRKDNIVIVQKVQAKKLRDGFVPFDQDFVVVQYVRDHFTKVDETPLFELYK
jgi:hypothetical protein